VDTDGAAPTGSSCAEVPMKMLGDSDSHRHHKHRSSKPPTAHPFPHDIKAGGCDEERGEHSADVGCTP